MLMADLNAFTVGLLCINCIGITQRAHSHTFFLGILQPLDEEQKDVDGDRVDEDEDGDEHVRGKTDVRGDLEQIPGTECSLSPFRVQLTKTREAKLGQQGRN